MSDFTLQCWVPSISSYSRVTELTMGQYTIISKFILNNDNKGLGYYFETILNNNFKDKILYKKLTKYDKWFILTFLRAVNISPTLTLKAKDLSDKECTYDIDLLNILTRGSEFIPIYKFNIEMDLITAKVELDNNIFFEKDQFNFIKEINTEKNKIELSKLQPHEKLSIKRDLDTILEIVAKIISKKDNLNMELKLIPTIPMLKEVYEVSLSLFDNTLFDFLKLIFSPYSKGVFAKKYFLTSKIGMDMDKIDSITPLECDIYVNLYNQDNTSKIKGNQALS